MLLLPHLLFRPLLLHLHQLSQNQTQSDAGIDAELDRAVSPKWMVVLIMIGVIVVVVIVISTIMMIGGAIVLAIVGMVNDGSMTHSFRRRPCDLPLAHSLLRRNRRKSMRL